MYNELVNKIKERLTMYYKKVIFSIIMLTIIFNPQIVIAATSITNGLVAWYQFEAGANDSSGNGNTGDQYNVEYVEGLDGKSLKLGGYDKPGFIVVPNPNNMSFIKNFTFTFWFNIQDVYGMDGSGNKSAYGTQTILAKEGDRTGLNINISQDQNRQGYFHFWIRNGYCCTNNDRSLHAFDNISESTIQLNEWHFGVVKADDTYIYIYLDGKLKNKVLLSDFNINPQMSSSEFRIGINEYRQWYPFNGLLDDVRVYNRALNDQEIQTLYNLYSASLSNTTYIVPLSPWTKFIIFFGFIVLATLYLHKIRRA